MHLFSIYFRPYILKQLVDFIVLVYNRFGLCASMFTRESDNIYSYEIMDLLIVILIIHFT